MRRAVLSLLLCALAPALTATGCGREPRSAASVASCGGGRVALQGACVEPVVADRYCGKSSVFVGGTCVPHACPQGQVLDFGTGACLGARALREVGAHVHVVFEEGQTLGCHEGASLRVANGHASCREQEQTKPNSAGSGACGAGDVRDAWLGRCVRIVRDGAVDVAAWTRAVLGADGGLAAPELCGRIGLDPSALGLSSGGEAAARITAELVFPNNDVTQVHARTLAEDESGRALPSSSSAVVEDAVGARIDALRALGGTASAASLEVRVRCVIHAGFQPIAVDSQSDQESVPSKNPP